MSHWDHPSRTSRPPVARRSNRWLSSIWRLAFFVNSDWHPYGYSWHKKLQAGNRSTQQGFKRQMLKANGAGWFRYVSMHWKHIPALATEHETRLDNINLHGFDEVLGEWKVPQGVDPWDSWRAIVLATCGWPKWVLAKNQAPQNPVAFNLILRGKIAKNELGFHSPFRDPSRSWSKMDHHGLHIQIDSTLLGAGFEGLTGMVHSAHGKTCLVRWTYRLV
jgi:hypothetical protein